MVKMSSKKTVKISGLVLFIFIIFTVAFFGASGLIFGVKIKNVNIDGIPAQSGAKTLNSVIKITGNAKNAITLSVNGREISVNNKGDFDETIALLKGYNILNIKAKDKFGYVDEKNYKLIY